MKTARRLLLFLLLAATASAGQAPDVAWDLDLGPDATFFPSLAVALATLRLDTGGDPRELGDKNGLLGVAVTAPPTGPRPRWRSPRPPSSPQAASP
jgi:hypothetical protein